MTAKKKTVKAVTDEQLGRLSRKFDDLKRRLSSSRKPFDFEAVMHGLQLLIESKQVMVRSPLNHKKLCRGTVHLMLRPPPNRESFFYSRVESLQDALDLLQVQLRTYSEEVYWFSRVYDPMVDPEVHPDALSLNLLYHAYCSVPDQAQCLEFPTEPVELAQLLWQAFAPYLVDAAYDYPQSAISIEPVLTDGCERLRVTAFLQFKPEHRNEVVDYFRGKGDLGCLVEGEWIGLD